MKNQIFDNTALFTGGGIFSNGCTPILINNTITGNECVGTFQPAMGGGIYTYDPLASFEGCNNIVVDNYGESYSNWYGNVYLNYSCSQESLPGTGNITDDPLFVNPGNHDFHLHGDSPCIDAGDPGSPLDPDGTVADMGALFYDQTVGVKSDNKFASSLKFALHSAYPNPFNPTTAISYQLPTSSLVNLAVYDISGNLIAELINGWRNAGTHSITLDGSILTSGIYIYRLQAGEYSATGKMVLIK